MDARRVLKGAGAAVLVAAAGVAASLLVPSPLVMTVLAQSTFYALFALGIGVLIRQNGMVSFGHAVFFGIPAYLVGIGLAHTELPAEVLLIGSVFVVALVAFLIGLVFVRVHGIAFGMLTLAVGQMAYEAATRLRDFTGGHDGMSLKFPGTLFGMALKTFQQPHGMFAISWCVMVLVVALVIGLTRSRFGRLTEAIRENEERAGFLGYRTLLPRAAVFALSAAVTAVGGVLFAIYSAFVSPDIVHWTASGAALIMAILGGTAVAWGPVLGAVAYFVLKDSLGAVTIHWLAIIGVGLIVVTVTFPQGLAGLAERLLRPRRGHARS